MEVFVSYDGQEVEIPSGLLPSSLNAVLSKKMLQVAEELKHDPSKIEKIHLIEFIQIMTKHRVKNTMLLAIDELEQREFN